MTEVLTQTTTPPPADTVQPVAGASTAPVTPMGGNTTPTPNAIKPAATLETPSGAGGGVDLETLDVNAYERLIEGMPDDGTLIESDDLGQPNQPTTQPAAAAAGTEVTPGANDSEEGVLTPGRLPSRLKVPTDDELSFHTARFFKESRQGGGKMTFGEAEGLAKQYLGLTTAAHEPDTHVDSTPAAAAQTAPPSGRLADLTQALEDATSAFEVAAEGFDAAEQARALREINRLNREIAEATVNAQRDEAAAVTQQAEAQQVFMEAWQQAEAQVHGMFAHANAADPASALHQRAAEIQAIYRDSADPAMQAIYNSPNSVLLYFTMAAQQLDIPPVNAPVQSPTKSTPPPVSRQAPMGAALLATSTGGTKPAAPVALDLQAITSSHQLEALIDRMAA